jgi:hypothetical protein
MSEDFAVAGLTPSPIKGLKEGNTEFLTWLTWGKETSDLDLDTLISNVLKDVE